MTRLSTETLLDLSKNINYKFSPAYVTKEIGYRKEIVADEYRYVLFKLLNKFISQYSIEKLIDIQDKNLSPFPDVLQLEIDKRKSERPFVHIDYTTMSPYLTIDTTYLIVSANVSKHLYINREIFSDPNDMQLHMQPIVVIMKDGENGIGKQKFSSFKRDLVPPFPLDGMFQDQRWMEPFQDFLLEREISTDILGNLMDVS